jgi:hypothetical protein
VGPAGAGAGSGPIVPEKSPEVESFARESGLPVVVIQGDIVKGGDVTRGELEDLEGDGAED